MLYVTTAGTLLSRDPHFPSIYYITTAVYTLRANVLGRLQEPLSILGMVFERVAFCSSCFSFNFILITCSDDITALICWSAEEICLLVVRSGHNSWIGIHLRQLFIHLKCAFTECAIRRRNDASFFNKVVDRVVTNRLLASNCICAVQNEWANRGFAFILTTEYSIAYSYNNPNQGLFHPTDSNLIGL